MKQIDGNFIDTKEGLKGKRSEIVQQAVKVRNRVRELYSNHRETLEAKDVKNWDQCAKVILSNTDALFWVNNQKTNMIQYCEESMELLQMMDDETLTDIFKGKSSKAAKKGVAKCQ